MDPELRDPGGLLERGDERRADLPKEPVTDGPACEARFRFAAPAAVASQNAVDGWHWADRAAHRRAWRAAAHLAADAAASTLAPLAGRRVVVTVALPVAQPGRRRDPHNWVGTCVKPILDGITDAGVLWPDDNSAWVEVREPTLWGGGDVVVRVAPAGDRWDPAVE